MFLSGISRQLRSFTRSTSRAAGAAMAGKMRSTLRPTISSTSCRTGTWAVACRAIWRPSRNTSTRSAIRAISSRRWLM